jgi:glycerate kinase
MRVICAPDSFKESLSAPDVAAAMARGIAQALPNATIDLCPIADGGEGTVDAMLAATAGQLRQTRVLGPLGDPIQAAWGIAGHIPNQPLTAIIEMAAASGLALVPPHQRDPTETTTYGTGQLIRAALDAGAQRIILGIGGSATTDAGCGAAQALGVRFLDSRADLINQPITGGLLRQITHIDLRPLDPRLARTQLVIACDVTNPLTGPNGAAAIYGPQKGASPQQVQLLDGSLARLSALMRDTHAIDIADQPGTGAAGGLGFGAVAFLGGQLGRGIDLVLQAVGFDQRVRDCDLCLTGEGRIDGQTLAGKALAGVARAAQKHHVPTIALVGSVGPGVERVREIGISQYHVIGQGLPVHESMARAAELLTSTTDIVLRAWSATTHPQHPQP